VSNPAKSSDFGADGYTASLTDWHELLQLTAPDDTCGLVFVRGQFPNTPGSILARVQRRDDSGSKGTFGTQLQPAETNEGIELGERRVQGWVNLRWPYTKYEIGRKDGEWDENGGTYEEISFVRNGTLVEIICIRWGHGSSVSDYESTDGIEKQTVRFKVGGLIQFGCPCSNGKPPNRDIFHLSRQNSSGDGLVCLSERYQKRLEMNVFVNGKEQNIGSSLHGLDHEDVSGSEVDISSTHEIEVSVGEPTFIVSTYSLRNSNDERVGLDMRCFDEIQDYLGTSNHSINMTDRLWTALCSTNYEASEAVEFCVIGRCVEQIMGVFSVPFFHTDQMDSEQRFHADGKVQNKAPSPENPNDAYETALICNIMTPQYVDVQSTL
jgi:hypothetical protein